VGYEFLLDDEPIRVEPVHRPGGFDLQIEGRIVRARLRPGDEPGEHWLELDGRSERVWIASRGDVHFLHLRGRSHRVEASNALERARRAADPSGGAEVLRAPMPGVVVEIAVAAGALVHAGELLMTIESMKLQTAISAPHDALVEEICVSRGDGFDQGDALVRLASAEPPISRGNGAKEDEGS
jgi:3-methylcrotonyl-CoA carboxylase alpha subunit